MRTLNYVIVIRNAHAVLPVVSVGIGQLIVFATGLIRYVKHASKVRNHLILLKSDSHHLCIIRIEFCGNLECGLAQYGRSLVGVDHEPT